MDKIQLIENCFIFKDVPNERVQDYLQHKWYDKRAYGKGEWIEPPKNHIGILVSGCVNVQRLDMDGKRTLVNRLDPMALFGMVDLFLSDSSEINHLVACTESVIAFLKGDILLQWLQSDPILLRNYMVHVHSRVRFLNQRIECFTYSNLEERVTHHMQVAGKSTLNMSEMAEYLGMSRASLYRSLERIKKRALTE